MTSGWIIALELSLVLGVALWFGLRELAELKRLRIAREEAERRRLADDGPG